MWCCCWRTDSGKKKKEKKNCVNEGSKVGKKELTQKGSDVNSTSSSAALPCMDKLREELSCAVRFLWFFILFCFGFMIFCVTQ